MEAGPGYITRSCLKRTKTKTKRTVGHAALAPLANINLTEVIISRDKMELNLKIMFVESEPMKWGCGLVGRVLAWYAGGPGFDPSTA